MTLRDILQKHPSITAVAAILIIIGSVAWIGRSPMKPHTAEQVYFYDLSTHQLFPADPAVQPPIDAPSGANNGVKAMVYGCGACDPSNMKIAFLSTYSNSARMARQKMAEAGVGESVDLTLAATVDNGTFVAAPVEGEGELKWVAAASPEGRAITNRAGKLCGDKPAKPCFPD